jgi:hypothetical protein
VASIPRAEYDRAARRYRRLRHRSGSKSSPFAFSFELIPKRTIGSYPLLLGHVAPVKLDRELLGQKIQQVDIQIESPSELFQQLTTRRMGTNSATA